MHVTMREYVSYVIGFVSSPVSLEPLDSLLSSFAEAYARIQYKLNQHPVQFSYWVTLATCRRGLRLYISIIYDFIYLSSILSYIDFIVFQTIVSFNNAVQSYYICIKIQNSLILMIYIFHFTN